MGKLKPIEQLADDVNKGDLVRMPVAQGDLFLVYLGNAKEVGERMRDTSLLADCFNDFYLFHSIRLKKDYIPKETQRLAYTALSIKNKEITQDDEKDNMPVENYEVIRRAKKR